jgi:hypothetical protein
VFLLSGNLLARADDATNPAVQQATIDRALAAWEKRTSDTKTFACRFTCFRYDPAFFPPQQRKSQQPQRESHGEIKYAAPDKGLFSETDEWHWTMSPVTQKLEKQCGQTELWAFDGSRLSMIRDENRTVERFSVPTTKIQRTWLMSFLLPSDSQGKPRPLELLPPPFGFAIKADELKVRFAIRVITSTESREKIWLELTPKLSSDSSRFSKIELILGANEIPDAIQMVSSNGSDREVLLFDHEEFDSAEAFAADTFAPHPEGFKLIESK